MSDTPIIPQTQPHKNLTPQQLGDRDAACTWLAKKGQYEADKGYARWGFNYFRDPGPHPAHFDQITIINIGAIE